MKSSTLGAAALALATLIGTPAAFADPAAGLWQTQPDDNGNFGHVEVQPCGEALCGTIKAAFDASGQPRPSDNIGKRMLWNMTSRGAGSYAGGKIWAPDRDRTYNSRMTLSGDTLEVSGCVLGICRGQTWTRVR